MSGTTTIGSLHIPTVECGTVVVGTGSAGYCAADHLSMAGHDVVVITDKRRAGASRNAGSDKQTYYKLGLGGDAVDSVARLATTLFNGGAMDGDNALVEAALSARAFMYLVDAGVPFPTDRFGQFIGYMTDHDPAERATSVGPYTSRSMTERLEERVLGRGVPVMEGCRVIDLVVDRTGDEPRVLGLLVLNKAAEVGGEDDEALENRFLLIRAHNVVYATGGPAGIYADSVYPRGQWGANGAALRAGAPGKNLTEWQFGLASTHPRWNVSGSYMQVVPRMVSTAADGSDEREFLAEVITEPGVVNSLVFLKGYQWPFDVRKAQQGSSLIDLLVYRETVMRGRRVWLDFRSNAGGGEFDAQSLSPEARAYLGRTGVLDLPASGPPVDRLKALNHAAYDFYLERGPRIDLAEESLEIAVCAQHNNGGLEVDIWWQSPLRGLFPVGEAAGTHGVYRPGGAALNSGQVGATRAAEWIVSRPSTKAPDPEAFRVAAEPLVRAAADLVARAEDRHSRGLPDNTSDLLRESSTLMSMKAGLVRSAQSVGQALEKSGEWLAEFEEAVTIDTSSRRSIDRLFLVRDIMTTQFVYLSAMANYLAEGGTSRGSVLYNDPDGQLPAWVDTAGAVIDAGLGEEFRFASDDGSLGDVTQIVSIAKGSTPIPPVTYRWRPVRPVPTSDEPFETVWRAFRMTRNVY